MTAMRWWIGAAITLAAAGTGVARQAQPAPQPAPQQVQPRAVTPAGNRLLTETQALFDGYVRDNKMPGIVAAFGVGDTPTQFVAAGRIADEANAPAAGPDTLWRIYSMTKPITGMAAMILVEDGKLKLDAPIATYLPAFAKMRVLDSPEGPLAAKRPAKAPITVRMLLTHTAGLDYALLPTTPLQKEYERLGLTPFAANARIDAVAKQRRPRSLQEFAARAASLPLRVEPGTTWHYSMSLDVLGAVIEKASGMSFERFVQTRLFDPLGMRSTFWTVPAGEAGRLATNYAWVANAAAPFTLASDGNARVPLDPGATSVFLAPPSFPYGGAGLVSTARDYDRFLHMLANGGSLDGARVMKPETVALAMSDLLPAGVTFGGIGGGTGGVMSARMGFGAGGSVYLEDAPKGPRKGTYGWGGAAGTIAWVDPARRIRGTVMVQYFPGEKWPLREEVPLALARDAQRLHGGIPGARP